MNLFQKLPDLLPSILTLVGSLIMLFIMDWQMTLLTFITIQFYCDHHAFGSYHATYF